MISTSIDKKFGLVPVADATTEILILGSLPSDESLSKGEYYAKPSNDYWKLLEAVLNVEMANLTYEVKIEGLRAHHIGLGDVFTVVLDPEAWTKTLPNRNSTISQFSNRLHQI